MVFHKTATIRTEPSKPMRRLASDNRIVGRALDYGCGRGFDADYYGMVKYDPFGFPETPIGKFRTITCNYVLNVIESDLTRLGIMRDIQDKLTIKGTAYLTVRNDKRALRGKTNLGTWQGEIILRLPVLYRYFGYVTYELARNDELNGIQSVRLH